MHATRAILLRVSASNGPRAAVILAAMLCARLVRAPRLICIATALALVALVVPASGTRANAETPDTVTLASPVELEREGLFGITFIEPRGHPPEGSQSHDAHDVITQGSQGVVASGQLAYDSAEQHYAFLEYDWSCIDGGAYIVTITFPDGTVVSQPFTIAKHPCKNRWKVTARALQLGHRTELVVEDRWSARHFSGDETIVLCVTTLGHRKCFQVTKSRQVFILAPPRHSGQTFVAVVGATDEHAGLDERRFSVPKPYVYHPPSTQPRPAPRPAPEPAPAPTQPCEFAPHVDEDSVRWVLSHLHNVDCQNAWGDFALWLNGVSVPVEEFSCEWTGEAAQMDQGECTAAGGVSFSFKLG